MNDVVAMKELFEIKKQNKRKLNDKFMKNAKDKSKKPVIF